jgi:Cu2+-exporting ATPase
MAEADHAVFDKTGTLTSGVPHVELPPLTDQEAGVVRTLASNSAHPASRAVAAALAQRQPLGVTEIRETPGYGIEGKIGGRRARLGRSAWVDEIGDASTRGVGSGLAFAIENSPKRRFILSETLRDGAVEAIAALWGAGMDSELVSGDSPAAVRSAALLAGIEVHLAEATPQGKIDRLAELRAEGRKALMVGDGLNDAPALAAGHVSMAPASASDAGRQAADFVFTRESLMAVAQARTIAIAAQRLVRQNFALAVAYNFLLVPLAFAGMVTPLVAAVAMSTSSVLVIGNSLRLRTVGRVVSRSRRRGGSGVIAREAVA